MEAGATALTSTSTAPGQTTGKGSASGTGNFLETLGADSAAATRAAKLAAKKAGDAKSESDKSESARSDSKGAETAITAHGIRLKTKGEPKTADASESETSPDEAEPAAPKGRQVDLPMPLVAALAAGAAGRTNLRSSLTKLPDSVTAAEAPVPDAPGATAAKGKANRLAAARKDAVEPGAKDEAHPGTKAKATETADAAKTAATKHAMAAAAPSSDRQETLQLAPTASAPQQAVATGMPNGDTQTSEVRVPLSQATSHAAATLPTMLVRVHSKEGTARSIEIRLDPPELGIVDVKLETGKDGRLSAVLSTERSDSFELLKRESGALEAALRDAGVNLEDGALSFSLNENGTGGSQSGGSDTYAGASSRREAVIEGASQMQVGAWRDGIVDISV